MRGWWLLFALTACTKDLEPVDTDPADTDTDSDTDSDTDTDTDTDTDSDTDSDTDTDTDSDTDSDPDPMDGLVENPGCEDYMGTPVAGATAYFVGDYDIDASDVVTGFEYEVLFANDKWVEYGGYDCTIVWIVTGTKGDPVGCGTCDYSLSISAVGDKTSSDCLPALEDEEAVDFDVTYNVKVDGEDTTYYFTSGTQLGTGWTDGSRTWWRDDGSCKYY